VSKLLHNLMNRAGISNEEAIEKKRQELAGAITRIVINETITEAKKRAKIRDEILAKKGEEPPKSA
jgi:NifU-like protein involved in Fe-S cluster formation